MHFAATLLILFESPLTILMKRHRHFDRQPEQGWPAKLHIKVQGISF